MKEKVYKPIVKAGDHLVQSKSNPQRVRGISQDSNNRTTDIVEWEEIEIESIESDYQLESMNLTPQQQFFAEVLSSVASNLIIYGAETFSDRVLTPFLEKHAKPFLVKKTTDIKQLINEKVKKQKRFPKCKDDKQLNVNNIVDINEVKNLNQGFNSIFLDMSPEEAKIHGIKLIYHMIGIANEIRILTNVRLMNQVQTEQERLESQTKIEKFLVEEVAKKINELLSENILILSHIESLQLFDLLGGGVRINGEYVPVKLDKVNLAINSIRK